MNNYLDNGAVLPSGLLGEQAMAGMEGFNKSYKNTALRVGIIVAAYPANDEQNRSKLMPEYDVVVVEQNEDRGATTIVYRNCMSSEGMGSIADYFERTLRPQEKKTTKGDSTNLNGQDGAIVLVMCLDSMSDKAIIVGNLTHPDRKTTLKDKGPRLEGQFNGVNVKIEKDGSTTLTFIGATDNQGKPKDKEAGPTKMAIEKDGSFQVDHKTITLRLDKKGDVTLKAKGAVKIDCETATITATKSLTAKTKDATIEASGKAIVEGKEILLGKGASEAVIKGDAFKKIFDAHTHPTPVGPSGPPTSPMPGSTLSKKVTTE